MVIKVRQLPADDFSMDRVQNIENDQVYVDVSCGQGARDWHTSTADWGEPISRLRDDISFELVKE